MTDCASILRRRSSN